MSFLSLRLDKPRQWSNKSFVRSYNPPLLEVCKENENSSDEEALQIMKVEETLIEYHVFYVEYFHIAQCILFTENIYLF